MTSSLNTAASLQHFQDQIAQARFSQTALRIRGGGSKDFYGNALGHDEVLDTRGHSGITSYEPSELVVTVRAGTPLVDLEAALLEKNQYLPFEPPHFQVGFEDAGNQFVGTVGGMVASGLSGAARAVSGSVRDHILGVEIINGSGEVLRFGGTVMKNVAGYDVSRLMAGSMGTLALLTEVSIKVLPKPLADKTLCFDVDQATALKWLNRWRGLPLPINSSSWVDGQLSRGGKDILFVRLRGAIAAVDSASQQLLAECGGYPYPDEQSGLFWQKNTHHLSPSFVPLADNVCLWRLSVPAATPPLPLSQPQHIEWQGAQRWLWASSSDRTRLQAIANAVGGHAVLFRASLAGCDADKQGGAFQPQSAVTAQINQGLRQQLDPHGVFSTGRI
jgi:glycolate oxidase FAD binding subunit